MKTYSPSLVIGDTLELPIKWVDADDQPITFLQRRVDFMIRSEVSGDVLVSLNSIDDHELVDRLEVRLDDTAYEGELVITVPASSTALFPRGTLPYQVQVTDLNGAVKTILKGTINTLDDVVR